MQQAAPQCGHGMAPIDTKPMIQPPKHTQHCNPALLRTKHRSKRREDHTQLAGAASSLSIFMNRMPSWKRKIARERRRQAALRDLLYWEKLDFGKEGVRCNALSEPVTMIYRLSTSDLF